MELKGSPAAPLAEDMDAPQGLPSPQSEAPELQTTAVSPHGRPEAKPGSTGHQGDLVETNSSPAEHPEGPTPAPDHGPAEMEAGSAQSIPIQLSSAQLSPSSSSVISNSTEEQLIATTSPRSPAHCSSPLCSDAHSPPSPVQCQPESASRQTPPPDASCQQSLLLHSPPQVCASQLPQHPSDDCGPPPDQEPPGTSSRDSLTVFRLHPHSSPLHGRSGAVIKQDSPKPLSAPCSPPPSQPPSRRSVSLPASPAHSQVQLASSQLAVQSEVILKSTSKRSEEELDCNSVQTGLAGQNQAVENSLASLSPGSNLSTDDPDDKLSKKQTLAGSGRSSPAQSSSADVPPIPTPQSLVHSENRPSCFLHAGEEMVPSPPLSPGGNLSQCTENNEVQKTSSSPSPPHNSQMPTLSAASGPACALTAGPSPATDGSSAQPSNLLESPVGSPGRPVGSQAVTPHPTNLHLLQSNENVAAHHPHPSVEPEMSQLNSSPGSLDHVSIVSEAASISDAPGDPVPGQEKMLSGSAEDTQTNVGPLPSPHPSHAPSLTTALTSCRPSPCNHTLIDQGSPLHENTSRSSPSSAPITQSSLAQTTADLQSSPHSLAQSSKPCSDSPQSPVLNTENNPGPSSSLNVDVGAGVSMLNSLLPDQVHSESGPNVGEMVPEPVSSSLYNKSTVSPSPESAPHTPKPCVTEGQPSPGSRSPACPSATEAGPSPTSPGSCSPTQVNGSMPSCSNLPEASACAQAPSPPAGTSSPADSKKCGQTADTQVCPSPGSSPSEEPPSTGPGSPVLRESSAAEGEYQEKPNRPRGKELQL